jgi:hypothetical protein
VPVLPLIDLLILLGWTSLAAGALLKAVAISTVYRPTILTFSSMDFVIIAAICFGFALTLAARTWVKINEPKLLQMQRRAAHAKAQRLAEQRELEAASGDEEAEVSSLQPEQASAGHR